MQIAIIDHLMNLLSNGLCSFAIELDTCKETHLHCMYPGTYHDLDYGKGLIKDEYLGFKFECVLYCFLHQKVCYTKKVKNDYGGFENGYLNGNNISKKCTSKCRKIFTKDPQRLLAKTWITVQLGSDVFKYKHPYQKTFRLADFCAFVENLEIVNKIDFESDACINQTFNEQIKQHFIAVLAK